MDPSSLVSGKFISKTYALKKNIVWDDIRDIFEFLNFFLPWLNNFEYSMQILFLDVLWDPDRFHFFQKVVLGQHAGPVVIVFHHVEKGGFFSIGDVLEWHIKKSWTIAMTSLLESLKRIPQASRVFAMFHRQRVSYGVLQSHLGLIPHWGRVEPVGSHS